jgi:hypothetical protein
MPPSNQNVNRSERLKIKEERHEVMGTGHEMRRQTPHSQIPIPALERKINYRDQRQPGCATVSKNNRRKKICYPSITVNEKKTM